MCRLTETQARIILALADNGMKVHAAAKALHYGRTTVEYHLLRIRRRTGLNPKNFHDLQILAIVANTILREEAVENG